MITRAPCVLRKTFRLAVAADGAVSPSLSHGPRRVPRRPFPLSVFIVFLLPPFADRPSSPTRYAEYTPFTTTTLHTASNAKTRHGSTACRTVIFFSIVFHQNITRPFPVVTFPKHTADIRGQRSNVLHRTIFLQLSSVTTFVRATNARSPTKPIMP